MYTDEKPRRGNLLKEFILKLILIIIFVLLLIWLVPWPNMDAYLDALNPLKDQIFNANLQTMKEAGITYFTSERLPENIGDKKTLTLQQMLDMKLLIPFTDRNGNSCDVQKSFVSLEKQETEYLMKVNLKCGEEEDYILVHLGCYSYCTKDICEAKPQSTEKPSTKPVVKKDNLKPTPTPTSTATPTYTPKYQCRKVNGQYWGKNWTVVDYQTYVEQCLTTPPTPKYYCQIVNGQYWGKDGVVVDENTYNQQCGTPITKYYCQIVDGKYYGKNGDEVTKEIFEAECTTKPKYYCQIVDGKYYGKNGDEVDYNTYIVECTPNEDKEWEYKKELRIYHAAEYSEWTPWKTYTAGVNEVIKNVKTDTKEVVDLGIVTEKKTVEKKVVVTKDVVEQSGYYNYVVCKNFTYAADGETIVEILSDWYYTNNWYRGYNPPADTISSRWIFQGVDFSQCGNDCVNHPYVIYRQQVRDVKTYTKYSNVTAECTDIEHKSIPLYVTRKKPETKTVQTTESVSTHKYKMRTRTLIKAAYEEVKYDYKWSYYNDLNLLRDGYVYTGKSRVRK